MSRKRKVLLVTSAVLLLIPIILMVVVTVVNDNTASAVEVELISVPLPENTVYLESFSRAGRFVGNGNGMQYLGAMLITSELTYEELESYYSQYDCQVYVQNTAEIDERHGSLHFTTDPVPEASYRVEKWGDAVSWFFYDFDLRGH